MSIAKAAAHVYEIRPRKDKRGVDLISEALPFGLLWYRDADAAVGYPALTRRCSQPLHRVQPQSSMINTRLFQADLAAISGG